jgi:hypothetical protein
MQCTTDGTGSEADVSGATGFVEKFLLTNFS